LSCFIWLFDHWVLFCPDSGNVFQILQSPLQQPSDEPIKITHKTCACFCLSMGSQSLLLSQILEGYLEPTSLFGLKRARH
jgi:hypothetical protein